MGWGATKPPWQACQSQYEFTLDGGLGIKVGCHRQFEGLVILWIFQDIDNRFGREPVADSVAAGALPAGFGLWACAVTRVAAAASQCRAAQRLS